MGNVVTNASGVISIDTSTLTEDELQQLNSARNIRENRR